MKQRKKYQVKNKQIDTAIDKIIGHDGGSEHGDLLKQMMTTVLKLKDEKVGRGDLKVLNTSLKELRWAFKVFKPYRYFKKVSVFGSARTKPSDPVFKTASRFGKIMAQKGWMVITGGSSGVMHAGNQGAGSAHSFGANILLPMEQDVNTVVKDDRKLIHFKYFFTRKLIFVKESDAICLFAGGFGTHDEGFEALTLIQTGKMMPRPIVLLDAKGGTYWKNWLKFVRGTLLKQKMIDPADMHLFTLAKTPLEACDIIRNFYKVYHSMRFVGENLVIRMNQGLSDAAIKKLNRNFSDIVKKGKIKPSKALPAEHNEPEIKELPRLVFKFDMHHFGRLKLLVDAINSSVE